MLLPLTRGGERAVNAAGLGSIVGFEIRPDGQSEWLALIHEDDYPAATGKSGMAPGRCRRMPWSINLPLGIRLTNTKGEQIVSELFLTNWTALHRQSRVLVSRHRDTVYYALSWRCGKWCEIDIMQGVAEWAPNSDLHLLNLYFLF
ncbi:hypothetical protein LSUE1_G001511, partial [Lachnellula suecica]